MKKPEPIEALSVLFRYGENSGDSIHRSHISVHRPTTKYFSNSFVFKTEIEKEGLPGDITPAGGPEFKSRRPDHFMSFVSHRLTMLAFLLLPL
jgi:hypothetical protein